MQRMDFTAHYLGPGGRKLFLHTLSCSFQVENGEGSRGILPSLGGCDHRRAFHHMLHPPEYESIRSALRRDTAPRAVLNQDPKTHRDVFCEIRVSPPI